MSSNHLFGLLTTSVRGCLVAAVTLSLSGCDRLPSGSKSAPFVARLGKVLLQIPARPDLYQAQLSDGDVHIRVCARRSDVPPSSLCSEFGSSMVNENGVWTVIRKLDQQSFTLIRERPALNPPAAAPLTAVPEEFIDRDLGGGGEAYALGRLFTLTQDDPLLTTDNGWPVGRCAVAPQGHRYCSIGFLIDDAFVDARWHAQPGAELDQAEVWSVASALDKKLRALQISTGRERTG